jgi:hypothetical protein|tara:strand:- start:2674 stop:2970 length:297 start_codon:yes stop_codon:yes gene_type:complete
MESKVLIGRYPYEKVTCSKCRMMFELNDPQEAYEVTTCAIKECHIQFWHTSAQSDIKTGLTYATRIREGIEPVINKPVKSHPEYEFIDRTPKGYGPDG